MAQFLSCQQKSVLGLLLPLFQDQPKIRIDRLAHAYQHYARSNFSPRTFGFKNIDDLLLKLDVFDRHDDRLISISEAKLLDVLVRPLSSSLAPSFPPVHELKRAFERENGFNLKILLIYCKAESLQQLFYKCSTAAEAVQVVPHDHSPLVRQSFGSPGYRLPLIPPPRRPPPPSLVPRPPSLVPPPPSLVPPPILAAPQFTHRMELRPQLQLPITSTHHISTSSVSTYPNQAVPPVLPALPSHSSVNRYQGVPPGEGTALSSCSSVNRYPNQDVLPGEETFLPALSSVRPDMEIPTLTSQLSFPSFSRRETKVQALEKLEVYLQNRIAVLSSKRKHLPADIVVTVTKQATAKAIGMMGKMLITWRDIKCTSNFTMVYSRVNEFIRCFCWNTSITSLYELQKAILVLEECKSFDDLQMGPILTHPLVKDLFKPPADLVSVPEITGYDIQKQLATFISKHKKGRHKYELSDFLDYVAKQHSLPDPMYLCIRITSFPLALSVNFRFMKLQHILKDELRNKTQSNLEEAAEFEVETLKNKLKRMASDERELAKKNPVEIIEGIIFASMQLFDQRLRLQVINFMQLVLNKKVLRHLFLMAIYQGVYGIRSIAASDIPHQLTHQHGYQDRGPDQPTELTVSIPRGEITKELLQSLNTIQFPVDLNSLSRVEETLSNHYGVIKFAQLGQGSFLQFITRQPQILSALGGQQIASNVVQSTIRKRVVAFIQQLKEDDKDLVAQRIVQQFNTSSVAALQCGTIEKLIIDARQEHPSSDIPVVAYQIPLLVDRKDSHSLAKGDVLGPKTPNDALLCLKQAPLLEDLASWSHWDLVFAPYLGDITVFLNTHAKGSVYALELSPGRLVRIESSSSVADFVKAVKDANAIEAAGHLVTMVVRGGNVHDIPKQLLANYIQSKLEELVAASTSFEHSNVAALFIFSCLIRIPLHICQFLAPEVFIAPLRKVTNTAAVDGLLKLCQSSQDRLFLQALGMMIGIKCWSDDFMEMQRKTKSTTSVMIETAHHQLYTQSTSSEELSGTTPSRSLNSVSDSSLSFELPSKDKFSYEAERSDEPLSTSLSPLSEQELIEREVQCKEIVLSIRQNEFGYGLDLQPEQEEIARKQREREGRGLQRLSQELYSKDTHFVLELIQNADDNHYPPHLSVGTSSAGAVPTLKFILSPDCVVVLNNEAGFTEHNIRAICDVGKSTKDPHRSGYIGQKGIGFKSVFRVTDAPEIHSNNFHVKFDTKSGPVGYILPHWVEKSFTDGKIPSEETKGWTTRIVLPLKPASIQSQVMVNKFQDIHPSLLLFLNRLRCIMIEEKESARTVFMRRDDMPQGITKLYHSDGTDNWLVVRKLMTDASQYKPGVDSTELALAFPLPDDLQQPLTSRQLQAQQVFAFLPLRSYGFRFVVQGDFDLPSSREDVNVDSAWNQWLREEIPSLFLETLEKMKGLSEMSSIAAVTLFIQFVPLEGELHDFFKPVSGQILRLLQGKHCLPTDFFPTSTTAADDPFSVIIDVMTGDNLNDSAVVEWRQPSHLLKVSNELIKSCIPQSLLCSILGLSYLNCGLHDDISEKLTAQLGIGSITVQHLVTVAEQVLASYSIHKREEFKYLRKSESAESYLEEMDLEEKAQQENPHELFVQWVANWLACVCTVMDETRDVSSATTNSLKKLAILPLSNKSLTSLENGTLFFHKQESDTDSMGMFAPVFNSLQVIDPNLMHSSSASHSQLVPVPVLVNRLLTKLGVKELLPQDIIHHHIIPRLTNDKKKDSDEKMMISYLAYIKYAIDKGVVAQGQMVADLKESLILVTNKGLKLPSKQPVHFSSVYKPQWDLEAEFPGVYWTLISPAYLNIGMKSSQSTCSWKVFLTKLGVQERLAVERVDVDLQEQGDCNWRDVSEWRRSPDGEYTIRDYCCKELNKVVKSMKKLSQQISRRCMITLAVMLDRSWNEYKQFVTARYYDGANKNELGTTMSSFGHSLRSLPWLPSTSNSLLKGSEVYLDSQGNRHLLHSHVPYLAAEVTDTEFLQLLGVNISVNDDRLFEFLQQWSKHRGEQPFCTSLDHMRNVYLYLYRKNSGYESSSSIVDAFINGELIFVPLSNTRWKNRKADVEGRFYSVHKVCWCDQTTVLYRRQDNEEELPLHLPRVLSLYYHGVNDPSRFAFQQFGVRENLSLQNLIDLLEFNASHRPNPDISDLECFRSIAEVVCSTVSHSVPLAMHEEEGCVVDQKLVDFFIRQVRNLRVFPSQSKKWVTLQGLFWNDKDEIAKHFSTSDEVNFLQWPQKNERLRGLLPPFAQLCNIPQLSNCYTLRVTPGSMVRQSDELREMLYHMIPLIQRYLFGRHSEEHERLECSLGIVAYLERLQILSSLDLEGRYVVEVDGKEKVSEPTTIKQCSLQDDDYTLYVVTNTSGKITDKLSLIDVLIKMFFREIANTAMEIRPFLIDLVVTDPRSEEEVSDIVLKYELKDLPQDSTKWNIKPPKSKILSYKIIEEQNEAARLSSQYEEEEDIPVESTDSGRLTAWPPNAPVRDPVTQEGPKRREKASSSQVQQATGDVITLDDIKSLKETNRKEIVDHSHEEHQSLTTTSVVHSQEEHQGKTCTMSSGQTRQGHSISGQAKQNEHARSQIRGDDKEAGGEKESGQMRFVEKGEKGGAHQVPMNKEKGHNGGKQWFPHNAPDFTNVQSVDITDLMKTVAIGDSVVELLPDEGNQTSKEAVGRWGEWFVYNHLKQLKVLPNGIKIAEVQWMNENTETGDPYDLTIVTETKEKWYVEVKATSSMNKDIFPISWKELKFAEKEGQRYLLYRLYNAGKSPKEMHLMYLQDLVGHLNTNPVARLFLTL